MDLPKGPKSYQSCSKFILDQTCRHGQNSGPQFENCSSLIGKGRRVIISTDYSGMGCAEMAIEQFSEPLLQMRWGEGGIGGGPLRLSSICTGPKFLL